MNTQPQPPTKTLDQVTIRSLVDLRDRTLQKSRIAFSNRLDAIDRGVDSVDTEARTVIERWYTRFDDLEKEVERDIREMCQEVEIIERMIAVKGLGLLLSAKIVSMIDITRCDTISALWRYCGYAAINGERERPVRGEKLHYNKRLKTTLYLLGSSMLRSGSPYRKVYDQAREYYEINRPDWTKSHRHAAALRKMIKLFLSHLWQVWRTLEGLPTRSPYSHEYLGHTTELPYTDYGWEAL